MADLTQGADLTGARHVPRAARGHLQPLGWRIAVMAICAVIATPILAICILAVTPEDNIWPHLLSTVLPSAVQQTLLLMLGVGSVTLLVGTGTAWLVTMYTFPGRSILVWALLLPLAMPTYLIAFCFVEVFDYSGATQTALRELFGWHSAKDYWFPDIRTLGGAVFVMSLVLYPYVYLTARASFLQQSACVLEVARTLGRTPFGAFRAVALPLARPALAAGVTLALMECLNDIGAVEYFGVNTLTVSVYATWLERGSLGGAAQIACVMLAFVLLLVALERIARRGQSHYHTTGRYRALSQTQLTGWRAGAASSVCALPVLLGFGVPVAVLLQSAFDYPEELWGSALWSATGNSLMLASAAAVTATLAGLVLAYARRNTGSSLIMAATRFASIGYAVPGTVLAVGILIPLALFDNRLDAFLREQFDISTGLLLSGSVFALVLAYTVRFMAVSFGTINAGFGRISPSMDAASRALGAGTGETLWRVHLPMLRPAIGAAALLVFVDSMKELPATLLLRPFNFDTLSTHVYTLASLDLFEQGALASLTIVAAGLIPVLLLHHTISKGRPGSSSRSSAARRAQGGQQSRPPDWAGGTGPLPGS